MDHAAADVPSCFVGLAPDDIVAGLSGSVVVGSSNSGQ
jgi:hypothetical protein